MIIIARGPYIIIYSSINPSVFNPNQPLNNFNKVVFVHNYYNAINFDYFYNFSDFPDIVIFDGVEYSIGESYYPSVLMQSKEYNPAYETVKDLMLALKVELVKLPKYEHLKSD